MSTAVITLCKEGAEVAVRICESMPDAKLYVHEAVEGYGQAERFARVVELTSEIFGCVKRIIYIMPCGVAVRAIGPMIKHKLEDPAVVVLDVMGRWAVSLLSGHEGGANDLALEVSNIIGAEPVISTTTEAVKRLIVGVGCRKGMKVENIEAAILAGLDKISAHPSAVRLLATAGVKKDEEGIREVSKRLGIPLVIIPDDEIRKSSLVFERSEFVQEKVNLPAVAEPAALLAGRRTVLCLPRIAMDGVTVAIAEEGLPS
ncbi:MAG: cobalamin biosynthesis protein [Planctomycetes bacterium]|nr:cobalamin biosynthesis protein [Planctomycetota bacterium]